MKNISLFKSLSFRSMNMLSFSKFSLSNLSKTTRNNLIYAKYVNKQFSSVYVNHRDTEDNNEQAPFDFTSENYKKVDEILVSRSI